MDYVYLLDSTEVEELLKYPVLIYPHPMILSEKKAELLRRYAEEGGCLILGARTGLKDETGKCVMDVMPGLLSACHSSVCHSDFWNALDLRRDSRRSLDRNHKYKHPGLRLS